MSGLGKSEAGSRLLLCNVGNTLFIQASFEADGTLAAKRSSVVICSELSKQACATAVLLFLRAINPRCSHRTGHWLATWPFRGPLQHV